jgi:hypothetical protein
MIEETNPVNCFITTIYKKVTAVVNGPEIKGPISDLNWDKLVPFRPTVTPHNDAAHQALNELYNKLDGLPTTAVRRAKYEIVVGSFLAAAQSVSLKPGGRMTWPHGSNIWTPYTVKKDINRNVREKLVAGGFIRKVEGTGTRSFADRDKDDPDAPKHGSWTDIPTIYELDEKLESLNGFNEAEWLESFRPAVMVSEDEDYLARNQRKLANLPSPKLGRTKLLKLGKPYSDAVKAVNALNEAWRKHPLCMPATGNRPRRYVASATRVFHYGSMTSGGRYYGAFTNVKGKQRLECTIDGNKVAQVDISASQPTLFSSLLGEKVNVDQDKWTNTYTYILAQLENRYHPNESDEDRVKKAKSVIMELIGTGNPNKASQSKQSEYAFTPGLQEWDAYRSACHHVFPALRHLNTEHMNGPGFLSFHESEILRETMEGLLAKGITSYPMHDCILVEAHHEEEAVDCYRSTINTYIKDHCLKYNRPTVLDIMIPLTVEMSNQEKKYIEGWYS